MTKRNVALVLTLLALATIATFAVRETDAPLAPAKTIALEPTALTQPATATATPPPAASARDEAATAAPPPRAAAPYSPDLQRTPALRAAFERESPDATAHQAEAHLRAIYEAERDADTILRAVRCTRSVCKLDLRWSPELNKPYNDALVRAIKAFSRDVDLTPDVTLGGPEMPIPMTLFIARPGYSVASLVAEQAAALQP